VSRRHVEDDARRAIVRALTSRIGITRGLHKAPRLPREALHRAHEDTRQVDREILALEGSGLVEWKLEVVERPAVAVDEHLVATVAGRVDLSRDEPLQLLTREHEPNVTETRRTLGALAPDGQPVARRVAFDLEKELGKRSHG